MSYSVQLQAYPGGRWFLLHSSTGNDAAGQYSTQATAEIMGYQSIEGPRGIHAVKILDNGKPVVHLEWVDGAIVRTVL